MSSIATWSARRTSRPPRRGRERGPRSQRLLLPIITLGYLIRSRRQRHYDKDMTVVREKIRRVLEAFGLTAEEEIGWRLVTVASDG